MKLHDLKVYIGETNDKSDPIIQLVVGTLRYKIDGVECCIRTETEFDYKGGSKTRALNCVVHNLIARLISEPLSHDGGFEFAPLEYDNKQETR